MATVPALPDSRIVKTAIQTDIKTFMTDINSEVGALGAGSGVLVSSNDSTLGYLNGKLAAGEGIDLTEGNDGGDETLTVAGENATTTNKGIAELATVAECETGTDTGRVVTPAGAKASAQLWGASGLPTNYITGLTFALDTDTDHDIAIAVGKCRDASDTVDITLSTIITKTLDGGVWAVGDDQPGMDTAAAVAANTIYHVWLIKRSDTGVVDALYSTSATVPTMPASYDYKRWLGWVLTDGTSPGNITAFQMFGDGRVLEYWYDAKETVASGLTSNAYATQAISGELPTATGNIVGVLYDALDAAAVKSIYLSIDGTNQTSYLDCNTAQAIQGNTIFVPPDGNNVHYKAEAGGDFTLKIVAAKFKR